MSKIVFLQEDATEYSGIMSLASLLKSNGHIVYVFIDRIEKDIFDSIEKISPQILAFSCMTSSYFWVLEKIKIIKKKFKVITIIGGPHPTFYPEIINDKFVDIICRGEGEYSLLELVDAIDNNTNISKIQNLWIKLEDKIYKNDVRNFVENLDELPFPDRSIYYNRYEFLKNSYTKHFIAGRGCPYLCTFCHNIALKQIYNGKGKYIRYKSVNYFVKEIKDVKLEYGVKTVIFDDDTFTLNHKWLSEFLPIYKKEINLPFNCTIRVDTVDEKIIKMLKDNCCFGVSFGIESGNEDLRQKILGKKISNEQIMKVAELLKKYKIKFLANNMMGIPGETLDNALETIKLNSFIKTDIPWCSILQPFPGTPIAEYAIKNNYLDQDFFDKFKPSFFMSSVIKQDNIRILCNLQKFFVIAVKFPFLLSLIKTIIKFPLGGAFFKFIFLISYIYTYKERHNLSFFKTIVFGWQSRHYLRKK